VSFNFTVTQVTQNFTATLTNPINLTFTEDPDTVNVVNQITTVTVVNNVQPVTISGVGGGNASYNQSLNTTDNVAFASVTTPTIYGPAQAPVLFPNGISVANVGNTFNGSIDLGQLYGTFTNQVSLILALLPLDFGTAVIPGTISINFGPV
jgi:hypothetical protein